MKSPKILIQLNILLILVLVVQLVLPAMAQAQARPMSHIRIHWGRGDEANPGVIRETPVYDGLRIFKAGQYYMSCRYTPCYFPVYSYSDDVTIYYISPQGSDVVKTAYGLGAMQPNDQYTVYELNIIYYDQDSTPTPQLPFSLYLPLIIKGESAIPPTPTRTLLQMLNDYGHLTNSYQYVPNAVDGPWGDPEVIYPTEVRPLDETPSYGGYQFNWTQHLKPGSAMYSLPHPGAFMGQTSSTTLWVKMVGFAMDVDVLGKVTSFQQVRYLQGGNQYDIDRFFLGGTYMPWYQLGTGSLLVQRSKAEVNEDLRSRLGQLNNFELAPQTISLTRVENGVSIEIEIGILVLGGQVVMGILKRNPMTGVATFLLQYFPAPWMQEISTETVTVSSLSIEGTVWADEVQDWEAYLEAHSQY